MIPVLVRAGADVNAQREREGWTPLARAVDARQTGAAKALLTAGADPARRRPGEPAPLEQAVRLADPALVEVLLAPKPPLTPSPDVAHRSASLLHMAIDDVQEADSDVVRLLLAAGANSRTRDERGATAYARAVDLAGRAGFAERAARTVAAFKAAGVAQ